MREIHRLLNETPPTVDLHREWDVAFDGGAVYWPADLTPLLICDKFSPVHLRRMMAPWARAPMWWWGWQWSALRGLLSERMGMGRGPWDLRVEGPVVHETARVAQRGEVSTVLVTPNVIASAVPLARLDEIQLWRVKPRSHVFLPDLIEHFGRFVDRHVLARYLIAAARQSTRAPEKWG